MNIEKHIFEGGAISAVIDEDNNIDVQVYPYDEDVYFTKGDIIVMAKAVGVTADDLIN